MNSLTSITKATRISFVTILDFQCFCTSDLTMHKRMCTIYKSNSLKITRGFAGEGV